MRSCYLRPLLTTYISNIDSYTRFAKCTEFGGKIDSGNGDIDPDRPENLEADELKVRGFPIEW